MRIAIGSDHRGFHAKQHLVPFLRNLGHEVQDMGTLAAESCDYPDFALLVCKAITSGKAERGVLICGTNIGMCITANKVRGIRCALCWNTTTARLARQHNNANMVSIGERVTGLEEVRDLVRVFLSTEFEGGRHQRRIDKIEP